MCEPQDRGSSLPNTAPGTFLTFYQKPIRVFRTLDSMGTPGLGGEQGAGDGPTLEGLSAPCQRWASPFQLVLTAPLLQGLEILSL